MLLKGHEKEQNMLQKYKNSFFNGSNFMFYFNLLIEISSNYILKNVPGLLKINPDF